MRGALQRGPAPRGVLSHQCRCVHSSPSADSLSPSPQVAVQGVVNKDVYLKPSVSPFRRPSIVFNRLQHGVPSYAMRAPPLGRAAPLFSISSTSCDYFAIRIPLLKAGFKRVPASFHRIPCNLVWGRSQKMSKQSLLTALAFALSITHSPGSSGTTPPPSLHVSSETAVAVLQQLQQAFPRKDPLLLDQAPAHGQSELLSAVTNALQLIAAQGSSGITSVAPHKAPTQDALRLATTHMVNPFQRFNHFPGSHQFLGCKKGMAISLGRMAALARQARERRAEAIDVGQMFPGASDADAQRCLHNLYDFTPRSWIYPEQREELLREFNQSGPTAASKLSKCTGQPRMYIWKPARGSCGRGIFFSYGAHARPSPQSPFIMDVIDEKMGRRPPPASSCGATTTPSGGAALAMTYIVQEYVANPLLIHGRKMDLRLYVAVTSYNPLIVYQHEEGLVRFAAHHYDDTTAMLGDGADAGGAGLFSHLTNYSLGRKLEKQYSEQQGSEVSLELKWGLQQLWDHLDATDTAKHRRRGTSTRSGAVRQAIKEVVVKTLLASRPRILAAMGRMSATTGGPAGGFFELYGFDIMLDDTDKPWLIEVNTLPSLESSSTLDYDVKSNVITDLLNIIRLEPFERPGAALEEIQDVSAPLLEPVSAAARPYVRSIEECPGESGFSYFYGTPSGRLSDADQRRDVEATLDDESAYRGGFHRIFPLGRAPHEDAWRRELDILIPLSRPSRLDDWAMVHASSVTE